MFGFFKRLFGQNDTAAHIEQKIEQFKSEKMTNTETDGLNFKTALEAHQKWKHRLKDYMDGTSTEKLDYQVVCKDDQCILGKWIYTQGMAKYEQNKYFTQLIEDHKKFHSAAGTIIKHIDEGHLESAQTVFKTDYLNRSLEVQKSLLDIYIHLNEK